MFHHISRVRLLKRLLPIILPPKLLFRVKRRYYVRAVQSFWEADTEPIKYLVKPGHSVLDIGANVGWYTCILAPLVGEHGRVYSIEPITETFQILSRVIQKLELNNVEPINCAISERDGSTLMEIPVHDYGGQNFYQARIVKNQRRDSRLRQHGVELRSIDSLFVALVNKITFIKCDVEGHELSVIKGARQFLTKSKPAWLMEISGNPDQDDSPSKELFERMKEQNYIPYWFDGRKLNRRSRGDQAINYFFLQPSHLGQLGPIGVDLQRGDYVA